MLDFADIKSLYVHGGTFHADDVLVAAFLKLAAQKQGREIQVIRGNKPPAQEEAEADGVLVADIGGGPFDHHSVDKEVRPNGVPYAALGLVVRAYGVSSGLFDNEAEVQIFDSAFIQDLDLQDNRTTPGKLRGYARSIRNFNPVWNEPQNTADYDNAFAAATNWIMTALEREIIRSKSIKAADDILRKEMEEAEDGILILDQRIPYQAALRDTAIKIVVSPSDRGNFMATAVIGKDGRNKVLFPEAYRGGHRRERLPAGMSYCHPAGFCAAFDTLNDALRGCRDAIAKHEENAKKEKAARDAARAAKGDVKAAAEEEAAPNAVA